MHTIKTIKRHVLGDQLTVTVKLPVVGLYLVINEVSEYALPYTDEETALTVAKQIHGGIVKRAKQRAIINEA